jgi:MinD superfamily P-loop ATPase
MEENRMKIAILSGKGGTGKTLVSVNLAAVADEAVYIDCDVEEPNGHLFFKPADITSEKISVKIPVVNESLCNGCRICVDFCKFNALAYIGGRLRVFETICHSCGGCILFCPAKALSEKDKVIGEIRSGLSQKVSVVTGILNTGEASGIPIIKKLLDTSSIEKKIAFIDCPPGSACIVMESIKDADYCILVGEPTLFGVHNFNMVYELVKDGENPAEVFCRDKNIKILGKIPFDTEIGTLNSNAFILARVNPKYYELFASLLQEVIKEAQHETVVNS